MNKFDLINFEHCISPQQFLNFVETGYEKLFVVGTRRLIIPIDNDNNEIIDFQHTEQDYYLLSSTVVDLINQCPSIKYLTWYGKPLVEIYRKNDTIYLNIGGQCTK